MKENQLDDLIKETITPEGELVENYEEIIKERIVEEAYDRAMGIIK